MMETKDYVSMLVGFVLAAGGVLPLLRRIFNDGVPAWFELNWLVPQVMMYIVAIAGFYLMINSVIEITNSNSIGWWSFLIAVVFLTAGVLKVLHSFGKGYAWFELAFIGQMFYQIIFVIEGLLLIVAGFAMEI